MWWLCICWFLWFWSQIYEAIMAKMLHSKVFIVVFTNVWVFLPSDSWSSSSSACSLVLGWQCTRNLFSVVLLMMLAFDAPFKYQQCQRLWIKHLCSLTGLNAGGKRLGCIQMSSNTSNQSSLVSFKYFKENCCLQISHVLCNGTTARTDSV